MSLINYIKTVWNTLTVFNPTNMNHIEDGIKSACDGVDELQLDTYASTNNMFTIRKQGKFASILLNGSNASFKSDGITLSDTIPSKYRPNTNNDIYTKVYNGSSYVDCRFRVDSYGNVQFMNMTGGSISGIQLQFIVNNCMVYSTT